MRAKVHSKIGFCMFCTTVMLRDNNMFNTYDIKHSRVKISSSRNATFELINFYK